MFHLMFTFQINGDNNGTICSDETETRMYGNGVCFSILTDKSIGRYFRKKQATK